MSVTVKICGIRTLEAAKVAIDAGADFLGFNFVLISKRYIKPQDALKIINQIRGKIKIVGVFQDSNLEEVNEIALSLGLDFVQLHGKEDNEYIRKIKVPVIKSITSYDQPKEIEANYFLLDRVNRGQGEMVDLEKATEFVSEFPIFFAGSLNPENVTEVIQKVRPFAVDVAGGIETNGLQDLEKIKLFIQNAKGVNI